MLNMFVQVQFEWYNVYSHFSVYQPSPYLPGNVSVDGVALLGAVQTSAETMLGMYTASPCHTKNSSVNKPVHEWNTI